VFAEAIRLFHKIVYGRRSDDVGEAPVWPQQRLPIPDHCIADDIAGCLVYCSEAYRGQVCPLGINHTGAAESANKMIKSSPRSSHFVGICEADSKMHELKAAVSQAMAGRQFQITYFLREVYGLELSCPILRRIDL
jgi:hypothetical protein